MRVADTGGAAREITRSCKIERENTSVVQLFRTTSALGGVHGEPARPGSRGNGCKRRPLSGAHWQHVIFLKTNSSMRCVERRRLLLA